MDHSLENPSVKFHKLHVEASLKILIVLAVLPSILFIKGSYDWGLISLLGLLIFVPIDKVSRYVFTTFSWFKKYYMILLGSGILSWLFNKFGLSISAPFYLVVFAILHMVYYKDIFQLEKKLLALSEEKDDIKSD